MAGGKRGAPVGNQNALKHGRSTAAKRAERLAEAQERQRKSDEWCAAQPKVNYQRVIEELEKERAGLRRFSAHFPTDRHPSNSSEKPD